MIKNIISLIVAIAVLMCLYSCDDGIEVKQDYDFSLSAWHLQSTIRTDEEVEIRFTLHREGNYKGAEYLVGYTQIEGEGEVYDVENNRLINRELRDMRLLPELDARNPEQQVFTLFYKSADGKKTEVQFRVVDNFGKERILKVIFSSENSE